MNPTALADQLTAAARDARRHLDTIAAAGHGTVHPTTDPTGWLVGQILRTVAALTSPTARACRHVTAAPRVLHAAVWAPGIVVCPACVRHLAPAPGEDNRCDRCRRTVAQLHPSTVALGPLLIGYGLCRRCQHTAGLAPPGERVEGRRQPR
ncbi:hypothetical protein [Parafrankia sp. EUN1f]|uniref:hypothetical protein n=1 Tax=Parafrankia sp. EUN1f TaxID=102897 RepID=UPI0001C43D84|nr:hypothetical protein [Parafrankia sp. EUN1f]EFC86144.1 hypothetical protein FrEUN1fDRAFT_0755 [Parafrankia sp. EUN1f]